MRNPVEVTVKISNLKCYDEADGPGSAEPYLWTIFFKVDGETVQLGDRLTLEGVATVIRNSGAHNNLLTRDVDAGDSIPIPNNIGEWKTVLKPISLSAGAKSIIQPLQPNFVDIPGIIGMICILMEEDGLPDNSAIVGYDALVSSFTSELNREIAYLGATITKFEDQTIKAITNAVSNAVKNAIRNEIGAGDAIWAFIVGADQQVGQKILFKNSDELIPVKVIPIIERWTGEAGDWEINGEVNSREIIPPFGDITIPSKKEPNLSGVIVYEDWKFNSESVQPSNPFLRVRKQKFAEGTFNLPFERDFSTRGQYGRTLGVRPNTISSIKIGEGYYCELFSDLDAKGESIEINQNTEALIPTWNDRAKSIKVSKVGVPH